MLFDTHCHINDKAYDADRREILTRAAASGVGLMLCPATDMETSRACIDLANSCDGVYAAVGIHPELAATVTPEDAERLRQWVRGEKKVVAIGEVGLDYHWPEPAREIQQAVFIDMVKLAVELECRLSSTTAKLTAIRWISFANTARGSAASSIATPAALK